MELKIIQIQEGLNYNQQRITTEMIKLIPYTEALISTVSSWMTLQNKMIHCLGKIKDSEKKKVL